jgi:hypothetical protein
LVTFSECDPAATTEDVDALERNLGFAVPDAIRKLTTSANGGRPNPNIYRDSLACTDVSECLALRDGKGSIWWTYELLVLTKKAVPVHYLPFAVDSGGNTFFVDCRSGTVHLLLHDPTFRSCSLSVGLDEFWSRLVEK